MSPLKHYPSWLKHPKDHPFLSSPPKYHASKYSPPKYHPLNESFNILFLLVETSKTPPLLVESSKIPSLFVEPSRILSLWVESRLSIHLNYWLSVLLLPLVSPAFHQYVFSFLRVSLLPSPHAYSMFQYPSVLFVYTLLVLKGTVSRRI